MGTLWQDIRYGARLLRQRPGFTLTAVAALALGIGANTAIYSIAHAVFLRPLAVAAPASLVLITNNVLSYPDYVDLRAQSHAFKDLSAFTARELSLAQDGQPERIVGYVVTGNYFDVLGVKPVLGRTFLPEE